MPKAQKGIPQNTKTRIKNINCKLLNFIWLIKFFFYILIICPTRKSLKNARPHNKQNYKF